MTTVTARITSKNQLTLPAKLVRKYGFENQRTVTITAKNGRFIIEPEQTLAEALEPVRQRIRKHLPKDFDCSQMSNDYDAEINEAFAARYKHLAKEARS